MAINIDEMRGVQALFNALHEQFGPSSQSVSYEEFVETMIRLDVRAEAKTQILEDPFAQERVSGIEHTMTSLSPAEQETIRQFVIYGELSTAAARSLVKGTGLSMERWSVPSSLVAKTGWLAPKPGNTSYDDMEQNVYSINASLQPFLQAYFLTKKK